MQFLHSAEITTKLLGKLRHVSHAVPTGEDMPSIRTSINGPIQNLHFNERNAQNKNPLNSAAASIIK